MPTTDIICREADAAMGGEKIRFRLACCCGQPFHLSVSQVEPNLTASTINWDPESAILRERMLEEGKYYRSSGTQQLPKFQCCAWVTQGPTIALIRILTNEQQPAKGDLA